MIENLCVLIMLVILLVLALKSLISYGKEKEIIILFFNARSVYKATEKIQYKRLLDIIRHRVDRGEYETKELPEEYFTKVIIKKLERKGFKLIKDEEWSVYKISWTSLQERGNED